MNELVSTVLSGVITAMVVLALTAAIRNRRFEVHLIERANRTLPAEEGFAIGRVLEDGSDLRLQPIGKAREYQITLRNTSLQKIDGAEIQFGFSAKGVLAGVPRTTQEGKPLLKLDPYPDDNYEVSRRYQVSLSQGDSIEFTFQAIEANSNSTDYGVALYKTNAKLKRQLGERPATEAYYRAAVVGLSAAILGALAVLAIPGSGSTGWQKLETGGCKVAVLSAFQQYQYQTFPWRGPWIVHYQFYNYGPQCIVSSAVLFDGSDQFMGPLQTTEWTKNAPNRPALRSTEVHLRLPQARSASSAPVRAYQ